VSDLEREARLFDEASALDPSEREAYLREACAGDEELFARMVRLLEADDATLLPIDAPALSQLTQAKTPETIGPYRILGVLGSGGMGVVYEAEQSQPRRRVALKVLKSGLLDATDLRRFEHEAQVLGWLHHPGIAQIFEAGSAETETGPQPYLVMELVEGRPLLEFAREHGLGTADRLKLLARLCDAVQHAHQRGVIHRDLKPTNVLVDGSGQPKVLDFGIARVTGSDFETQPLETRAGQLIGTLPYMSPEQVSGDPSAIDTRSDVYALGVIGYQLLAGVLPLSVSRRSVAEAARIITEDEPTTLSAHDRGLRGDVETIFGRAIAKEKDRRYVSAEALAADIRRHLANEPIVARPPSTLYQLGKFAQRNRALVGGVVGIVLALSAGLVVSLSLFRESERRGVELEAALSEANVLRTEAQERLAELRETQEYFDRFFEATSPYEDGTEVRVVEVLERMASEVDTAFPTRPLSRARLLHRMGSTYQDIGLPLAALDYLRRSRALYEEHGHPTDGSRVMLLDDLAAALRGANEHEEALDVYRELLPRMESELGPSRALVASRVGVSYSLVQLARFEEARAELAETRVIAEALTEERDEALAVVADAQAACAWLSGNMQEAEAVALEAVERWEALDPNSNQLALALQRAAEAMFSLQRYEEAAAYQERSARIMTEIVGEDHVAVLQRHIARQAILSQWRRDGRHADEWDPLVDQAAELYGADSDVFATTLGYKGMDLFFARRYEEAEPALRDTVGILRENGAAELDLASNLANLACVLESTNQLDEALECIAEAIDIREALVEPTHYRLGWDFKRMASILQGLGDLPGAEEARARVREIEAANGTL